MRPHGNPQQAIFDALVAEMKNRKGHETEVWMECERNAVHRAACAEAQRMGKPNPSIKSIERAETYAMGHSDYAATWAYKVANLLHEADVETKT